MKVRNVKVAEGEVLPGYDVDLNNRASKPPLEEPRVDPESNFAKALDVFLDGELGPDGIGVVNLYREFDCTDIQANKYQITKQDMAVDDTNPNVYTNYTISFDKFGRAVDVREEPLGVIVEDLKDGVARDAIDEFKYSCDSVHGVSSEGEDAIVEAITTFTKRRGRSATDVLVASSVVEESDYDDAAALKQSVEDGLGTSVHVDERRELARDRFLVADSSTLGFDSTRAPVKTRQHYEAAEDTFYAQAFFRRSFDVIESRAGLVVER